MVKVSVRKGMIRMLLIFALVAAAIISRVAYMMLYEADRYGEAAYLVHTRERRIKASRGLITDRSGVVLAGNRSVCNISVIHSQISDEEKVIDELSKRLSLSREEVSKKVKKVSSREKIKSNVDKETADEIRNLSLDGVMVDEDSYRVYPFGKLHAKVLGFTGADNQGVIGLEVGYDRYLKGRDGKIFTYTTAAGIEIEGTSEERTEPTQGYNLVTTLDINIMSYAGQLCERVKEAKNAKSVKILVMDPNNGEILAMASAPEFDPNDPTNMGEEGKTTDVEKLNAFWRNSILSDTYEPGSVFKIVTAVAALEEGCVKPEDRFFCRGYLTVEDRKIRCAKAGGHGSQTFVEGVMNSCNPVFMEVGARVGAVKMYEYYRKMGLFETTGVDLTGEANSIMHKLDNVGPVELATMSFGQSFQITPLQMIRACACAVNGGKLVTPHIGKYITDQEGNIIEELSYPVKENVISEKTSTLMREILCKVVAEGTGNKAYIEGYNIGGKTATSQKLPRGSGKYIASFMGFADAYKPSVMAMVFIDEPEGGFYGGAIAAPVIKELFENILPYLNIEQVEKPEE